MITASSDATRILDAAWRVLERSRFRSLKVRQVLTASGVSAAGFYRLFPGKSHLLLALMEDETRREVDALTRRIAQAATPRAQLRAWVREVVAVAYDERRAARARMFLDPVLLEEQAELVQRQLDLITLPLAHLIANGVAEGAFASPDPDADARAANHMVRGFATERLAGVLPWPEERVVDVVCTFVERALHVERIVTVDAPGEP